jgi:Putative glycerate kinase
MSDLPSAAAVRALLKNIYEEALESVRGERLVENLGAPQGDHWPIRHGSKVIDWPLHPDGRIVVIGAGKAAGSLAKGLEKLLGDRISDGCIIVKHGHAEPLLRRIRQRQAGHPIPDAPGVEATTEMLGTVEGLTERDTVIVLLTGGASALMVAPADGVTLEEKAAVTDLLLRSGASIEEINAVRKRLSRVKGGGLREHIGPASVLTLLMSDVPSGDLCMIGSGPTIACSGNLASAMEILARYGLEQAVPASVRDVLAKEVRPAPRPAGRQEALMLADSAMLVEAVHGIAAQKALTVHNVDAAMAGNTHDAALKMTAALRAVPPQDRPALLVSAGETTLQVKGDGSGGRNQEYALVAALALAGEDNVALLAAGTDGTDGPTDAAGAFADGALHQRASAAGLDAKEMLARNDSYHLFEATGDLFRTGPTGTNVMDLVLGIAF